MENQKDKTINIILENAKNLFLTHGFAGTSMSGVAKASKIVKSLIYHYFDSKEQLWQSVKNNIHNNYAAPKIFNEISQLNFQDFVTKLVMLRFNFYINNPDIIKMIAIQRVEKGTRVLSAKDSTWYNSIKNNITKFKEQGYIKHQLDPDFATYFILSSTTNLFFDLEYSTIKKKHEFYITQITTLILNALQN